MSVALRRNLRRISLMRRLVASIEYGLLALGAAIVAFGVVVTVMRPHGRPDIAVIRPPAAIETVPSAPAPSAPPRAVAGAPAEPDTVGGIADIGLRR